MGGGIVEIRVTVRVEGSIQLMKRMNVAANNPDRNRHEIRGENQIGIHIGDLNLGADKVEFEIGSGNRGPVAINVKKESEV